MVKGKSKDGGNDSRADWKEPKELQAFCEFCAIQVLDGKKAGGFLTKTGVNAVIKQLGDMRKVVTHLQVKNKWDHLRKLWKQYSECFDNETGLGIDAGTGMLEASDEWWTQKIAACPNAPLKKKVCRIVTPWTTGKNAFCTSGQIPKKSTEESRDSANSTEFVDLQCEPFVNVDLMEVEGPSSSRARPAVNKGKGLVTSVHLFKPIYKKPRKKRSVVQEMSDSLKNISDVIVESRSVSTRTPFASTATTEFKEILNMVLSLLGVQSSDHLHLFSTLFFMEKVEGRHMFAALGDNKDVQLKWLER